MCTGVNGGGQGCDASEATAPPVHWFVPNPLVAVPIRINLFIQTQRVRVLPSTALITFASVSRLLPSLPFYTDEDSLRAAAGKDMTLSKKGQIMILFLCCSPLSPL